MAFGDDIIEHGAERAEQKGQPITSFARQKILSCRLTTRLPILLETLSNAIKRPFQARFC